MPTDKDLDDRLRALKSEVLRLQQQNAEIELHLKRQDEKLDAIILKLFAPERLQADLADGVLSVETPEDVDSLLSEFLAARGR